MLLLPSLFLLASINVLILHVATTNTEDVHHTNAYIVYLGESKPNHLELITSSHHQMLASVLGRCIWPESKSFSGEGLGPIPAKWKGYCQSGDQFNPQKHCNRKLIGAQYFIDGFIAGGKKPYNGTQNKEFISPRDSSGHGTHCASTAVGSFVSNVSSKGGLAAGNARGGAPRARLAVYKVGWRNCEDIDTADKTLVAGKVVLCFFGNLADASDIAAAAKAIRMAGGRGVIGASEISIPPVTSKGYPVFFPCHLVSYDIGTEILNYIRLTSSVEGGQNLYRKTSPNSISPAILKPDIAAPGVDILAASIPRPTKIGLKAIYVFYYGTSMATPHVAGIAALLKCLHPNWSPATIKSALVTTDPFDYGGGIVNPNAAKNPGLIYDMGQTILCRNSTRSILDVNIPSITVPNLRGRPVTVLRTVINVGRPNSEYQVFIDPPHGTTVKVKPRQLSFSNKVKKRSFEVTITKLHNVTTEYYFGGLTWTDGVHKVRIPISVKAIFPLVSDY
ncbi:hypothetical protein ACJIZ3_009069 [Penstemon smallii]|uniref:Uncharacterized protein n=1 Tax=Penstemon smallii TaxID=265156 RepID=A0ABD3TDR2_9LAMI